MFDQSIIDIGISSISNWELARPLTLSEWADEKAYLSPESAAEPGKWRTYSYQKEIMDATTDQEIETVSLMKSARLGYTKIINFHTAYHIEHDPCSQLIVQPTIDDANGYSKDEIAPMIRDTPCLDGLVADPKSRDSNNTITKKHYPGGALSLIGANSARGFRRITVRTVKFDEIDGYPPSAGHEGDQIRLGIKRTENFWNRKILLGSTPTTKGISRIEKWFERSDQRYYYVPCPICGHFQVLTWAGMQIPEDNPHRAYYECENCTGAIDHKQQREMVDAGEWRATKPFNGHAGFHIWAAYSFSPGATWGKIATRWMDANKEYKSTGQTEELKTVINTDLAQTWEEKGEGVDVLELIGKDEKVEKDIAPEGVLCITTGVDVQAGEKARLEMEIVGWGKGEESWSLDYVIIKGDPEKPEVWKELDQQLERTWNRDGVSLRINCMTIDHGGTKGGTAAVEKYVLSRQIRRVFAVKGKSTVGDPIVSKPSKKSIHKGLLLHPVGTDTAKDTIYGRLKLDRPGPGFCHFPKGRDEEYFRQLTSEEVRITYRKGVARRVWVKKRRRNEALDCRVYALAALKILRPDFKTLAIKLRKTIEIVKRRKEQGESGQATNAKSKGSMRKKPRSGKKRSYINSWRRH